MCVCFFFAAAARVTTDWQNKLDGELGFILQVAECCYWTRRVFNKKRKGKVWLIVMQMCATVDVLVLSF